MSEDNINRQDMIIHRDMIIRTENLTKIYGMGVSEVHALVEVNFEIAENEFVAVMGPSGSGKSTLMNILGCLDRPTSGSYYLADEDVSNLNKTQLAVIRNRRIGFVFQSYNLLANTSALENVMLPLLYKRDDGLDESQQKQFALDALDAVGLSDRVHHKPQELSGGQMQRVAIARALVNHPVLILADEPTGNLDTSSGEEIMELLRKLHSEGSTIVMVTHDDEIATFAQRIIHFRDGRIENDKKNGDFVPVGVEVQGKG
ncbi:MAG: ABC transporter ATP-binding protein [Anaerolineales bacterium]